VPLLNVNECNDNEKFNQEPMNMKSNDEGNDKASSINEDDEPPPYSEI